MEGEKATPSDNPTQTIPVRQTYEEYRNSNKGSDLAGLVEVDPAPLTCHTLCVKEVFFCG
jgi:hypothetical protein